MRQHNRENAFVRLHEIELLLKQYKSGQTNKEPPMMQLAHEMPLDPALNPDKSGYCRTRPFTGEPRNKVFVYGTLKNGFGNSHLLDGSTFVSSGTISGYSMLSLGAFPAIYKDDFMSARIKGECYEVTDEILAQLDILEGVKGGFYRREPVLVNSWGWHWGYVQDKPKLGEFKRVVSGDWQGSNSPTVTVLPSSRPLVDIAGPNSHYRVDDYHRPRLPPPPPARPQLPPVRRDTGEVAAIWREAKPYKGKPHLSKPGVVVPITTTDPPPPPPPEDHIEALVDHV